MKHRRKELSEDCWELILNRLAIDDFNSLQSPSLVCKQFLSITDRIRLKLEASDRLFYRNNCDALFRSLQRFRNLKEIELRDPIFGDKADVNYPIRRIASSGLDLQSLSLTCLRKPPFLKTFMKLGSTMKNLKILRCCLLECFRNHHLVAIADALPWLEELDIQFSCYSWSPGRDSNSRSAKYMVTDAGIEAMSLKLRGLRKIDITGQYAIVEDNFDMDLERNYQIRSLDLSCARVNNEFLKKIGVVCPNLQTLNVTGLYTLTEGIEEILKCCSQIKHLTVDRTREIVILLEQFKTRSIKIEHLWKLEEVND